jgi:AraC-like DNA-binding protein
VAQPPAARRLYDPRNGDEPVRAVTLAVTGPTEPERTNQFSIYWIASGAGTVTADLGQRPFTANSLLFFAPYQRLRITPARRVRGAAIQFHANFLCVETFHAETGCSGALFNDTFGSPVVALDSRARAEVPDIVSRILREAAERQTGATEAILAYLKLLLITATRLKTHAGDHPAVSRADARHPLVSALQDLVEEHYCREHAPSRYAALLHVTPKTLNRLVRAQLGKTMTDVVRERILIHAKWDLLHTLKPVKQVAAELGFDDELYFSRMFKKATGYSPTFFREFETAIRGGSNLSMPLSRLPIQHAGRAAK